MKCPECGHPAEDHAHWGECLKRGCHCYQTRVQIECDAWKAEAMAAREYIKLIEPDAREYAGQEMFERVEWGYKGERDAYLSACVKEDEQ